MGFTYSFTTNFAALLIVCLVVSAVGFYRYVYFISLGYGFSIAAEGVMLFILYRRDLEIATVLLCLLVLLHGLRLSGFLLLRERYNASYQRIMKQVVRDAKINPAAKVGTWGYCALLYTLLVSPVYFRLESGYGADGFTFVGMAIMTAGLCLETVADVQKTKAKALNPKRFCDGGLYRIVRCPNYFGEILFWTGAAVSSLNILDGFWEWGAVLIGYGCIVFIMFGGARRLELRQNKTYGKDPEYQTYVKKTPILLPFVPLYSLEKQKWLVR